MESWGRKNMLDAGQVETEQPLPALNVQSFSIFSLLEQQANQFSYKLHKSFRYLL